MKKSLIALAALSTIAGSVAAQSSVSVYGRLDAGYKSYETTTAAGVKTKTDGVGYSAFTNSRVGFTGTEDIGGGLKVGFVVEGNILDAVGSTGSNNTNNFNFGRQQYLTLSSNSGTLLIGKTDSQVKNVFDGFDAGFANNLTGAYDGMGTSLTEITGSNIIGNRRDHVIRYTSPKFSGFDVSVGMLQADTDTTTAAGVTTSVEDNSGYELAVRYAAGKLSLAGAYREADTKTAAVTGVVGAYPTTATTPTVGVTAANAGDSTTKSTALGGSYDFGPVVAFGQYFDQEDKNNTANTKVKQDAYTIGARVPLGKATLFASYTDGEATSATNVKTDFEGFQVGVKYDLSKRTYGYAAYGESELQTAGVARKAKADNLAFGLVHNF